MNSRERIRQLDGLRGLAVAAVFLHHALHLKLLWMGVDVFFVLSGFLITGILLQKKTELPLGRYIGTFYQRRALRILPAYFVFLLVAVAVFGRAWLGHWYLYLGAMNFIRPLHIAHPAELEPLWSLAVEEQFYLAWPLVVYYLSRQNLLRVCVALLVCAPLLRYLCTPLFQGPWAVYMLLPFRMDCLAAGSLIAVMEERVSLEKVWVRRLTPLALGAGVGSIALLARQGYSKAGNLAYPNLALYEATLLISVAVFLMVYAGVGRRLLSLAPLTALGAISFSIYLVHTTMLSLAGPSRWWMAAAYSLSYAAVMYVAVERPILSRGRRTPQSRKRAAAEFPASRPETASLGRNH